MIAILQDVTPCSLVEACDHSIGSCCLHYQDTLMVEDSLTVGTLLPDCYRYKQYIVKHNSLILLRCASYIVSFNGMFWF
jgi:hypothetical protein